MATALSLTLSLQTHQNHHRRRCRHLPLEPPQNTPFKPNVPPRSPERLELSLTFTTLFSSPSSPPPTSSPSSPPPPSPATTSTLLNEQFRPTQFLTNQEYSDLQFLHDFNYAHPVKAGTLLVRAMRPGEIDETVNVLAGSFADSMVLPGGYLGLLRFMVKQYLLERRSVLPHAVTLIGFYKEEGSEQEEVLAGTVEVVFNRKGYNASPPTPTPPRDMPYICNMTVKEELRRRGIGWHLLKASEELISKICSLHEVYLHCRLIDLAPFNMYLKAGYRIVKTDSVLVLLLLQRRKHLMCKELPALKSPPQSDASADEKVL